MSGHNLESRTTQSPSPNTLRRHLSSFRLPPNPPPDTNGPARPRSTSVSPRTITERSGTGPDHPHSGTEPVRRREPTIRESEFCDTRTNPREDETTCPICLDDLKPEAADRGDVARAKCPAEHVFHRQCLGRWVNEGEGATNTCPVCRAEISVGYERFKSMMML